MKHYKKIASFILSVFSFSLLTGCTSSDNNQSQDTNNEEIKKDNPTSGNNIQADDNEIKLEPVNNDTPELKISSNCIGCGRCAKTDPAHFDFNNDTNKAIVASQENLDSEKVKQAIDNCPAGAISL